MVVVVIIIEIQMEIVLNIQLFQIVVFNIRINVLNVKMVIIIQVMNVVFMVIIDKEVYVLVNLKQIR